MGDLVRVILADAQVLCRVGLCEVLKDEDQIEIIAEVSDAEELLEAVALQKPDVVIVDYQQPGYFDVNIAAEVKKISPDTELMVISSDDRKERVYKMLEDGVTSFLTKQCDQAEIRDALRATANGDKFYCHKILDLIMERSFPSKTDESTETPLSAREKEILTLVAKGKIAKEIASDLHISPHTIYTHRKNILRKLNLTSPTEMIVYALEHGLIQLE